MMNLSFGGDNEYVDSATKAANSGSGGLIASVLNLLGIGQMVAKAPDPNKAADSPDGPKKDGAKVPGDALMNQKTAPMPVLPAITAAETALGVSPVGTQMPMMPMTTIDPDYAMTQSAFDKAFKRG